MELLARLGAAGLMHRQDFQTALTVVALALQFGFMFKIHFLLPLALQLIVCVWTLIYWKLNR